MKKIILLYFSFTAFVNLSNAQWQKTDGPYGGTINCLAVIGKYIFAGTNSGVYISANMGANWTEAVTGLDNTKINAFTVSDTIIYAIAESTCIFLSADKGLTWTPFGTKLPVTSINVLTISGSKIFAGTSAGIYISDNNGKGWYKPFIEGKIQKITSLVVNGTDVFAGTWGGSVYYSADNGESWETVNEGLYGSFNFINCLAVCNSEVFVSQDVYGVYSFKKGEKKWVKLDKGWTYNGSAYALIAIGKDLYAGTNNGVYKTSNNGKSWVKKDDGLNNNVVKSFTVNNDSIFAGTSYSGIFLSTDEGENWYPVNTGINVTRVNSLAVCGTDLFAGTFGNGVFSSTDKGENWKEINNGIEGRKTGMLSADGNNLMVSANYLYFSDNKGTLWKKLNETPKDYSIHSLYLSGKNLFQGTTDGIFISTDTGVTWKSMNVGLPSRVTKYLNADLNDSYMYNDPIVNAIAGDGTNMYICLENTGIYRSVNNGDNWNRFGQGLPDDANMSSIAISGDSIYAGSSKGNVYVASKSDSNWKQLGDWFPIKDDVSSLAAYGTNVFAGTSQGILLYNNSLGTWTEINTGLKNTNIGALAIIGSDLYAGTFGKGVWKLSIPEIIESTGKKK